MGKSNKRDKHGGQCSIENRTILNSTNSKAFFPDKNMKTSTYFSDRFLVPRINQYLSDNKDRVYVDINDMVNQLQSRYPDYARRKRNAFKPMVEKAFSFVLQQCGMGNNENPSADNHFDNSSHNSSSDVEECNISDGEKTSSNSQMLDLYNSSKVQTSAKGNQSSVNNSTELIDLSSDDENVKKKEGTLDKNNSNLLGNFLTNKTLNSQTTLTKITKNPNFHEKSQQSKYIIRAKRPNEAQAKSHYRLVKRKKTSHSIPKHIVTFSDFGGDTKVLEEVCKLILHISHPEIYRGIGISSPRGFLLHGPPGCGKTLLATAIAGELEVELIKISGPELVGGVSGESEERIRELFETAVQSAPCVLFIDEVDAITPNRQFAQREMERRIVAQLLTCLDELNEKPNGDLVLVIGATNRPDSLDPALRRAGRFDREVCIGIPDLKAREKILRILCSNLNLASDFSYEELAQNTPGYVGADLLSLTREAAMVAVNRVFGFVQRFRNAEKKSENLIAHNSLLNKDQENEKMEVDDEGDFCEDKKSNGKHVVEGKVFAEDKIVENESKDTSGDPTNQKNGNLNGSKEENGSSKEAGPETTSETNNAASAQDSATPESNAEEQKVDDAKNLDVENDIDVEVIAENSQCFTPTLTTLLCWLRDSTPLTYGQLKNICITQDDFKKALKSVQPSAKREGFATVPDVTWDDVGSLADVREELKMSILGPVKFRKQFEDLGILAPAGILICGPPGCGKTLLAKAVANEAGINFISVKGPELLNMYVGESERAVRSCFQRARNSAPCVIFFDELDALCPRRSESPESGASTRVVNQLLTEMDGVEDRKEVYVMAATNRPDIIDPAMLRPGRLDKILYVGLPQEDDRIEILRALTKNGTRPKLAADVNLDEIAKRPECKGYSGADLAALVREAGIQSVKDLMSGATETESQNGVSVSLEHFERALKKIRPSVSAEDQKYYESLRKRYSSAKS